ncbi:hypothetical protein U8V72_17540 [Priestia filamentosa]|uniref:hypothetical protein n=1 Tax=Priestia filamentosa TaxID=1402861 RepID=UPI000589427C
MKKTTTFNAYGKQNKQPIYKNGDRVKPVDNELLAINAIGTVKEMSVCGLYVIVDWDKKVYSSKSGGTVELGRERFVKELISVTA